MSRVFLAEEHALGRMVVIKVLAPDLAEGMSAERFDREIRLVARLQNPHIVPLFSTGLVDGIPYYTMPYIDGESLRTRLVRDKSLKAADASQVLRDVARALEYAHANGVIHRDIKPDNILLSGNSSCVADFGIARALTAARTTPGLLDDRESNTGITRHGMAIGTPAYMSPEQATCSPDIDGRTDIYSFGCVAFELLTGKPPFSKRGVQELIVAHVVEAPPVARLRHPHIPPAMADMVIACLEKTASNRPGNATELISMLESSTARSTSPAAVSQAPPSIAVLPFENMSGDPDNEYFSDGISEEIINALTQIAGLRVAGRTSSFAFKGVKVDLGTVGEKLNVDTVLEGSVRKAGNRIRITAQLIKISDGYHLWSERFDRELTDVFAVQEEIATAIAAKLKLSIDHSGEMVKPPTRSVEAYELFVKGRVLYYKPGRQIGVAINCFRHAVELDDQFALAHGALADALSLSGYYGLTKPSAIIEVAHASAMRAVELAPESADAHHAVALWSTLYGGDRQAALLEWGKVSADPNIRTQLRCSYAVWGLGLLRGRWDAAVDEINSALGADPLNGFAFSVLSMMKTFAGQTNDVVAYARRGAELDPDSFLAHFMLQRGYHYAGMHAEAQAQGFITLELSGRHPWALSELAVEYASVGNVEGARAIYDELAARARAQYIQPSVSALTAVAAGQLDEAIEHCERAIEERDAHMLWAVRQVWDGWEPIYSHPRWKNVRKGIFTWRPQRARSASQVRRAR